MQNIKLMLDPGHGGHDPGAVHGPLQEKDVTLRISRYIRELLKHEKGITVRMTRERDTFLSLDQRVQQANTWQADFFLSIHINAGGGSGFETFIHPNAPKRTAAYQSALHQEIVKKAALLDRGRKKANFAVLRNTTMPAVLTENLFIDHVKDARMLKNENMVKAIASGHVKGIKRLLNMSSRASVKSQAKMYRVLIDGRQTGAFQDKANILRQVEQHLGTAEKIHITKH